MKEQQTSNINMVSRVAADTTIKGEIVSPNDIRIDGTFEGRLTSNGRVVIGDGAKITGDIVCCNIDIWGSIEGNIYVRDVLSLKDGGVVNGNIQTRRLHIELGATLNGNCKMLSEAEFDAIASSEVTE